MYNIHKCLRLLCCFTFYLQILDAQEACRFPVEFDNFNGSAPWHTIGTDTWYRRFAFGIMASEPWTLEFKVNLEELQGIQKLAVGLANDSDISGCGNRPPEGNLCFFGLTLNNDDKEKKWIAEPFPTGNGKNVSIPESCFLRFEYLHAFMARVTAFRDEERRDTIPGTCRVFRLDYPSPQLNSFLIQLNPSPPQAPALKAYLTELWFFNRQPLSFPVMRQSGYAEEKNVEIALVPNPNKGNFYLHMAPEQHEGISADIEIYNATGRMDCKVGYTGNDQQLELRDPRPGLYLLRLDLNGTTILRKFIVY